MTNQNSPVRQSPSTGSGRGVREEILGVITNFYLRNEDKLADYILTGQDIDDDLAKDIASYFTQLLNEILPEEKEEDLVSYLASGWNSCRSQILANYEKRIKEQ